MQRKNNKIRFISLILALITVLGSLFTSIPANAVSGSGHALLSGPNPNRHSSYGSHSSAKGLASTTYGFRIQAFDVEDFSGGDYSYFTVSNAGEGDLISLKANILNSANYKSNADWHYFTPLNQSRIYSFYLGGEEFTTKTIGTDSPEMAQIKSILGMSSAGYFADWDAAFQAYETYGEGHEGDDEWAKFLGIEPGHYYFFVVEGLMAMYDPDATTTAEDYSEKFIFTSYQDYVYDPSAKGILSCHTPIDPVADSGLANPQSYINQGSIAPFNLKFADGQPIDTGFAVYGDINGATIAPISLNIGIEYQGEPNTTDGEFKVATSLVKQEDNNGLSWYNFGVRKWLPSSDLKEVFRTAERGVITDDPYTVVMEDNYYIRCDSNNILASKLINTGNSLASDLSITWGNTQVSSGSVNAGYSIKPTALNGKTSTSAAADRLVSKLGNGTIWGDRTPNNDFTTLSILDAFKDNSNRAWYKTDIDAVGTVFDSEEEKLLRGKNLGTAIELVVKGKEVTSHKVTVTVDSGNATAEETWSDTYSSASSTITNLDAAAVCYVVVPNADRNDGAVLSALQGIPADASAVYNALRSSVNNVKIGDIASGLSIGLGCELNLDGYTVYEVIVSEIIEPGLIELPSYMLNRYFENIIQTSSEHEVKYQVNKDFTFIKENYTDFMNCDRGCGEIGPITRPVEDKDWRLEWMDTSAGTTEVDWDNEMRGYYFPYMGTGVWHLANRETLAYWTPEDTLSWANPSGFTFDYGFNLVRASVGDNRSISGIHYSNYSEVDSMNLLKIRDQFGVEPKVVKAASPARNPLAVVGILKEHLHVDSQFARYHGLGFNEQLVWHEHDEEGHHEGNPETYHVDKSAVRFSYYEFPEKSALGFRLNATPTNVLDYSFDSTVYKYSTLPIEVGLNSVLGSNTSKPISLHSQGIRAGYVRDGNEYRFANVRYNTHTLNFYPEVLMVDCIGGNTWDSVLATGYSPVYTLGEKMRRAKSSSLYLYKINGSGENAVTGCTYSDTMDGSSDTLGLDRVSIPAGSDVFVVADLEGVSVDLYGYVLDTIDKSVDATFLAGDRTRSYTEVVASSLDVHDIWNYASFNESFKRQFKDWGDKILDVENYQADFQLYLDGELAAENFSATIGSVKRNNTITDAGVFQLEVENGELLTSGDYIALINQIADDYQCTVGEAKDIFEASGIYTSILNAIESSTSSFNKSGTCTINPSWTSVLGNGNNWYDEKTRTFVVRRYTNTGNLFKNVTAADKIDYSMAPDGELRIYQNINAGKTRDASWSVSIFFNMEKEAEINDLLLGSGAYYDHFTNVGYDIANDTRTMLIHKVPVKNADFYIPAKSTWDFGH